MRIGNVGCLTLSFGLLLVIASGCDPQPAAEPTPAASASTSAPPTSDTEKTLYALGAMMGRSLEEFSLTDSEWDWVARGASDRALGRNAAIEAEAFAAQVQALYEERTAPSPDAVAADQGFLDEQAAAEGAVRYDSGLIMTELVAGTGDSPSPTNTVEVHYHGTLRDGTVFDSSVDRGQKARFPLNRVIPCWTEGVGKMKVGGKSRLVCPPEIAYGARGSGRIPPNAPIVFEVELFEIAE